MHRAAFLAIPFLTTSALADYAPDTTLADRQLVALHRAAQPFQALYDYERHEDSMACTALERDAYGLVAELELHRRGEGGTDPATAEPWAAHLASELIRTVGGDDQGQCYLWNSGSPSSYNAALGVAYAFHRYGNGWSHATKVAVFQALEQDGYWINTDFHNGHPAATIGRLLVAEAMLASVCENLDSLDVQLVTNIMAMRDRALGDLRANRDATMARGYYEANSPLYTAHVYAPLVFGTSLQGESGIIARILLENELLLQGHLWLKGGGIGAPQSRDYGGALDDDRQLKSLRPALWTLVGDESDTVDIGQAYGLATVVAATDYVVPETLRRVFWESDGVFRTQESTSASATRTPGAVYSLGLDGAPTIPWRTVTVKGKAQMGGMYGHALQGDRVHFAIYVRKPGTFEYEVAAMEQPVVTGDQDALGNPLEGGGIDADPDDFESGAYNFEQMCHGRTCIRVHDVNPAELRTHQYVQAQFPNAAAHGGAHLQTADGWHIGQFDDVYLAFRPLGTVSVHESRDNGANVYVRNDMGGIWEIATTDEHANLSAYAAALAARPLAVNRPALAVEFTAPAGEVLRLEYAPERRFVNGVELTFEQEMGTALFESPQVAWNEADRTVEVSNACGTVVYDWDAPSVTDSGSGVC